ncbi:MAG TPA: aminodeoxychorismate lyase, partial [Roseivirga sp.]
MQKRKRFVLIMVIFSLMLTTFTFYFYQLFYGANVLTQSEATTILIDKDDNFDSLRNYLYDEGIIEDALSFSFVAKVLKYPDLIKPGVYRLEPKMT